MMRDLRKNASSPRTKKIIEVKGASVHNLKNIDVRIPHYSMTVITGLSGSGKTSIAFGTLFAGWEAKYLQTFGAYTRQLMGKITRPPVDHIQGILPSVGLKQKSQSPGARAHVGNTSDIYPYLKLFYAHLGTTYSPISGNVVKKDTVNDVIDHIKEQDPKSKVWILSPLQLTQGATLQDTLKIEQGKGYTRVLYKGKSYFIEEALQSIQTFDLEEKLYLVVDRLVLSNRHDKTQNSRLDTSVRNAFFEGRGRCKVRVNDMERTFSDRFEADGLTFVPPSTQFFDPNNPHGACGYCRGLGRDVGVDASKVIPKPSLSLSQGAVSPWQGSTMQKWQKEFIEHAKKFPLHTPYGELSESNKQLLWEGNKKAKGIYAFFEYLASKPHKMQFRILHARYKSLTTCTHCQGTGLRKEVEYVKVEGKSLIELLQMNVLQLKEFFEGLKLTLSEEKIAGRLVRKIKERASYLMRLGLGYLTLTRKSNTLSGGEYQRIRLARALGSSLIDALYILDEPTTGLHPKDTGELISVLKELQGRGNTIVVVEHDDDVMRAADQIIDTGLGAGSEGGEIIFQGSWDALMKDTKTQSHTIRYLTNRAVIPLPEVRKKWEYSIKIEGIYEKNIKEGRITLPLEAFTVLTGVSGAGKSTLTNGVIYPALRNYLENVVGRTENFKTLGGDLNRIADIELVNQDALGKSSRSNPATYTKAYDGIRLLFANQRSALKQGYTPRIFSFNRFGGRCEECMGDGFIKVKMQFTPDVTVVCDACQGKRFKKKVLEISFQGKNIHEVLEMTVDEGIEFFKDQTTIVQKLKPIQQIGLGYLKLGQSSSTFSGGEAQRIKLSTYLGKGEKALPTFFIFDEPTTGLHFHDTLKLVEAFQCLVEQGHTVVVVEHNLHLIKCADWIIDLGPESGEKGGKIVFEGTPEEMLKIENNHTAHYLRKHLQDHHQLRT